MKYCMMGIAEDIEDRMCKCGHQVRDHNTLEGCGICDCKFFAPAKFGG